MSETPVIGKTAGSLKALKKQLEKGSGNGDAFITYVPKNEPLVVRFLQEPEEFLMYEDCWDPTSKRSFPFVEGLQKGVDFERKSTVFIVNAVDVDKDRVIALQVKQSVLTHLINRYERYGTLLDRDYEIEKFGEKLDTTYSVTPEAPKKRSTSKYKLLDLQKVLTDAYNAARGVDTDDDEDDAPSQPRRSRRRAAVEDVVPDEYDEDELNKMPWPELKKYAKSIGVTLVTKRRSALVEAIVEQYN